MNLRYKPDWDQAKANYTAWWQGEYIGRCGLWVTAPRDGLADEPPPPEPADPIARWTNLDYVAARNDWTHRRTFYGAEAFPVWSPGYPGHVAIPTFLGCPVSLDHRTGWWEPILLDDDWDATRLRLAKSGRWWRFGQKMIARAAREAAGRSIPSVGAFGGCGDTLAALRGSDRLLLDVLDHPDRVRRAEEYLMDVWFEVYDTFYEACRRAADGGSTCWFPLWAPGKFYAAQNDFSYMISPALFRELFLPVIRRQTEFLDYSVYHVDGVAAFAHVPALCELPRLRAVQILPGAGKPSPLHYLDVCRAVQAAGKNLHISIAWDEVPAALGLLSARGLFIATSCPTEVEAHRLIEDVGRRSRP